jgi:hypothetical protein
MVIYTNSAPAPLSAAAIDAAIGELAKVAKKNADARAAENFRLRCALGSDARVAFARSIRLPGKR